MGKKPVVFIIGIFFISLGLGAGLAKAAGAESSLVQAPPLKEAATLASVLGAPGSPAAAPEPQPVNEASAPPESLNQQIWSDGQGRETKAFNLASKPKGGANLSWEMAKAALALVFVVALIIFGFKALARFGPRGGLRGGKGYFKLTATMALDNKKYLVAIEVAGRQLILGVTPERVNLLQAWPLVDFSELEESRGLNLKEPGETEVPESPASEEKNNNG